MEQWEWTKIGGAVVGFFLISWGVVKILVLRQIDTWDKRLKGNEDAIADAKANATKELKAVEREWRLEMSSVKDAMEVKEQEARDGRRELHGKIEILDEKMQRDYARQETITDIRDRMILMDKKLDKILMNGR